MVTSSENGQVNLGVDPRLWSRHTGASGGASSDCFDACADWQHTVTKVTHDMNNHHPQETYYDHSSSRSPGSHRYQPQTLHRQPSRQFDAYGQMPTPLYTPDDHNSRYDRFDRMNAAMPGGYGYELPGAQTWNPSAFGGGNNFPAFGATGRMKSTSRGRTALPTVCNSGSSKVI